MNFGVPLFNFENFFFIISEVFYICQTLIHAFLLRISVYTLGQLFQLGYFSVIFMSSFYMKPINRAMNVTGICHEFVICLFV